MCFDGYSVDTSNDTCKGMFSLNRNVEGVLVTLLDTEISWFPLQNIKLSKFVIIDEKIRIIMIFKFLNYDFFVSKTILTC